MPTGSKTIFVSLLSASCGALLFALIEEKPILPTNDNISQNSDSLLEQKISELEQKNKSLAQEKESLQQQLLQIHATKVAADSTSPHTDSPGDSIVQNSEEIASENVKNIRYVENFRHWITDTINNPNLRIEQEIKNRFDAEVVNTTWATQEEQKVMKLFSENSELQGSALKDVKCHSSICEIAISATNIDQANQQFDKTNKALQSLYQRLSIISTPDLEKSVNNLYVTLGEEGFNFN